MVTTIISNKSEFANLAKECLNSLKTGLTYSFSFENIKQPKSIKQLGFIFGGLISALQRFYLDLDGQEYDKELLKEMLYHFVGVTDTIFLPTGEKVSYRKTLSRMTKEEASEFINRCIVWIDSNTECILPIGLRYLWTQYVTDEEIERVMQAPLPQKDELYLAQIRKRHCVGCGKPASEAHHIRQGVYALSKKNADYMAIPLCTNCHRTLHNLGEKRFLEGISNVTNNLNIEVFCRLLYHRIRNGY